MESSNVTATRKCSKEDVVATIGVSTTRIPSYEYVITANIVTIPCTTPKEVVVTTCCVA
jgi:hypothetical protein